MFRFGPNIRPLFRRNQNFAETLIFGWNLPKPKPNLRLVTNYFSLWRKKKRDLNYKNWFNFAELRYNYRAPCETHGLEMLFSKLQLYFTMNEYKFFFTVILQKFEKKRKEKETTVLHYSLFSYVQKLIGLVSYNKHVVYYIPSNSTK